MEGFSDALEDAKYIQALTSGRWDTVKPWSTYSEEEINRFAVETELDKRSLEEICQQPLGFYLFTRFLRSVNRHDLANFLVESSSLQINSSMNAAKLLRKFVNHYMLTNPFLASYGHLSPSKSSSHKPSTPASPRKGSTSSPSRRRSSTSSSYFNFQFNLARSKYAPITPETSEIVTIKSRPNQSILITGPAVDRLLAKLGITDQPKNSTHSYVSSMGTNTGSTARANPNTPTTGGGLLSPHSINSVISPRSQGSQGSLLLSPTSTSSVNNPFKRLSFATQHQILYELTVLDSLIFQIIKQQYEASFRTSPEYKLFFQLSYTIHQYTPQEKEFDFIRVLGRGGFGKVTAVRSNLTGKLYALKAMNKKRIKMKRAQAMCLAERDILVLLQSSPYIVGLKYAFSSKEEIHLVLDLMIGGDLCYHLNEANFSVEQARYYTVRIILALASLHDQRYVYRDLKPENILLDAEGQSKLSDLGLVCPIEVNSPGLSAVCGTRGYWAPEILSVNPADPETYYSFAVDWFSLGCCLYEFLTGSSPFRTEQAYLWKAKPHHNQSIELMSKEEKDRSLDHALLEMEPDLTQIDDFLARDLIAKLLIKNPKHRLGSRHYEDIMNHEWFEGIQWSAVHCMIPPFKPSLAQGNAAMSSEIGDFQDDSSLKKVVWDASDEEVYETHWPYFSQAAIQEEIVEYLVHQDKESAKDKSSKESHAKEGCYCVIC